MTDDLNLDALDLDALDLGPRFYVLGPDRQTPVRIPSLHVDQPAFFAAMTASRQRGDQVVARTRVGQATVSTVFLFLDHRFLPDGDPILWETMVFDGPPAWDQFQQRYTSHADALAGHENVVDRLERGEDPA